MTSLVVDASVAVKWVIEQKNSEQVRALVCSPARLLAPTLVLAEVGNVLWKYVAHEQTSFERANSDLEAISEAFDQLVAMRQLHLAALQLSCTLGHPVYDCFYLALAKRQQAQLVTADKCLFRLGTETCNLDMRLL